MTKDFSYHEVRNWDYRTQSIFFMDWYDQHVAGNRSRELIVRTLFDRHEYPNELFGGVVLMALWTMTMILSAVVLFANGNLLYSLVCLLFSTPSAAGSYYMLWNVQPLKHYWQIMRYIRLGDGDREHYHGGNYEAR